MGKKILKAKKNTVAHNSLAIVTEHFMRADPDEKELYIKAARDCLMRQRAEKKAKDDANANRVTFRTHGRVVKVDKYGNFFHFEKRSTKK